MTFRHLTFLLAILPVLVASGEAAFERLPQGPRSAALGLLNLPGAAVLRSLPGSFQGSVPHMEASVFVAPRLHGCDGLTYGGGAAVFPCLSGMLTLAGTRFGIASYREHDVSAGYFAPLSEACAVGAMGHLYHLSITGYGRASSFGVDAAFAALFGDVAAYYCCILNLNAPTIGDVHERLPQALVSGLVIQPAHPVSLTVELLKDLSNELEFRAGAEYALSDAIGLRAGIAPSTASYGVGCLIGYDVVSVEYALTAHRELGATHWFSVRWQGD